MEKISDVKIEALTESQYVKPFRMKYKQNGTSKIWDLVVLHESVSIIIFNIERKKLVFVKQFRPAVYFNSLPRKSFLLNEAASCDTSGHCASEGLTLELCAGIVDKTVDLAVTAQTEVLEECGYKVPLHKFERVLSYRSGVGVSGEKQTMFYVEVNDSMKVSEGGGLETEGELIDVIEMSVEEVKDLVKKPDVLAPGGFLFGVMWFLHNKAPPIQSASR